MRILEFSDSHLVGTRCPNTEALLDVVTEESPDLLIGNGDVIDLWVEKEEVIAQNPTVERLELLSRDIPTILIIGNHDFDDDILKRLFPNARVAFNHYADGFWFEHGHLRDVIWQGWPILRPIFDAHPEWAHWIFWHLYQPWRERFNLNPGNQKLKAGGIDSVFRQHVRTIWYRALSFADRKGVETGIVIGHTHASARWVPEYEPQLWDGGSIRDDGTYVAITDGKPGLKRV
ncbi:MAG: metallophosphoesterase [Anaerolineae bacterium]